MSVRKQLDLFGENKYHKIDESVEHDFWIYHAGMADGDGSFGIYDYRLSLIDLNIIKELADLYGVKITRHKKEKEHHNFRYMVRLSKEDYVHFLTKVGPWLVEKRKDIGHILKHKNIQIDRPDVGNRSLLNRRLVWMIGYFDAEGMVGMSTKWDKRMDKYYFEMAIKFTSTNIFVLRYLRKIMNMLFNKNNKSKRMWVIREKMVPKKAHHKQGYDLRLRDMSKIHIFCKVFQPYIRIKRKIDKMQRIINYARFCAIQRWTFGRIDFNKNKKMRDRWLSARESE